jgi:hypothetical protein
MISHSFCHIKGISLKVEASLWEAGHAPPRLPVAIAVPVRRRLSFCKLLLKFVN